MKESYEGLSCSQHVLNFLAFEALCSYWFVLIKKSVNCYVVLLSRIYRMCFRYSFESKANKQAHFLFSKAILNVGRARIATLDFAKYIYHMLGTYHDVYQFSFFILYM